jgi:hypothetical protein
MRAYERSWVLSISEPMKATSCPIRYVPLTFGALHVGELWASRPGGADRTRRHIHLMEADRVKVDVVAQGEVGIEQDGPFPDLLSVIHIRTGRHLTSRDAGERLALGDLAGDANSCHQNIEVGLVGKVSRIDNRLRVRIGGGQRDASTAPHLDCAHEGSDGSFRGWTELGEGRRPRKGTELHLWERERRGTIAANDARQPSIRSENLHVGIAVDSRASVDSSAGLRPISLRIPLPTN